MSASERPRAALLQDRDTVVLIDRKQRVYLRTLRRGGRVAVRGLPFPADGLIGREEGCTVDLGGERFLVLRPTYAQLIPALPRQAQPIYPKDVGMILLWGDVRPGDTVVEVGIGAGATTLGLLRAVGPTGRLVSYELREDFARQTRDNVARFHGDAPNWTVRVGDAIADGLLERDVDRIVVDLPEPWTLLPHAATALRAGGVLSAFVPTALQVKSLVDALRAHGGFGAVEVLETLARNWHVGPRSLRPEHRMVAHTGFLVFARRLSDAIIARSELTPTDPCSSRNALGRSDAVGSTHDDEGGDPPEDLDGD